MSMNVYHIFAALHEEAKDGWVWLSPATVLTADFVRIRNPRVNKLIVCEGRAVDRNFRNFYQSREGTVALPDSGNFVVMNAAFRAQLEILQSELPLEIDGTTSIKDRYLRALLHHPDAAIRLSATLALVSLAIGFLGLIATLGSLATALWR